MIKNKVHAKGSLGWVSERQKINDILEGRGMMKLEVVSNENVDEKRLRTWVREAVKAGCESIEELNGYLLHRYGIRVKTANKVNFSPAIKKMIPWIIEQLDKKYEAGNSELSFAVKSDQFLLEMGKGSRRFIEIGYIRVAASIRKTLQFEGININCKKKDGEKFYIFSALTDDDVIFIESRDAKNQQTSACRKIAKEVCNNKVHNDDDDSLWKDAEFIKKIGKCDFDVDKIEDKAKKEKKRLIAIDIANGFNLLFDYEDKIRYV